MAEIQRASAWEIRLAKGFGLTRLESLRDRIIAFAIVAALVPSLVTAFIAYDQNRRSLDARIREELRAASEQGSREVGLWVGQRVYDLKVFASSFEIAENLRSGMPSPRVREYLNYVRRRVGDHEEIMLLDLEEELRSGLKLLYSKVLGSALAVELPHSIMGMSRLGILPPANRPGTEENKKRRVRRERREPNSRISAL